LKISSEENKHKCAFDLEDQHPKSKPSLSTKSKRLKVLGEENKHTNVPSTPKDQTFKERYSLSTRRKHLTVPGEENKNPNCALDPVDQTSYEDEDRIRGLYICSFVTNIRDCI